MSLHEAVGGLSEVYEGHPVCVAATYLGTTHVTCL